MRFAPNRHRAAELFRWLDVSAVRTRTWMFRHFRQIPSSIDEEGGSIAVAIGIVVCDARLLQTSRFRLIAWASKFAGATLLPRIIVIAMSLVRKGCW